MVVWIFCYLFISEFVMFRKIVDGTGKKKGFFDIVFFLRFLTYFFLVLEKKKEKCGGNCNKQKQL